MPSPPFPAVGPQHPSSPQRREHDVLLLALANGIGMGQLPCRSPAWPTAARAHCARPLPMPHPATASRSPRPDRYGLSGQAPDGEQVAAGGRRTGFALDGRDGVRVLTLTGGNLTLDSWCCSTAPRRTAAASAAPVRHPERLRGVLQSRQRRAGRRVHRYRARHHGQRHQRQHRRQRRRRADGHRQRPRASTAAPSPATSPVWLEAASAAVPGQPLVLTYSHQQFGAQSTGTSARRRYRLPGECADPTRQHHQRRRASRAAHVYRLSLASTLTLERSLVTGIRQTGRWRHLRVRRFPQHQFDRFQQFAGACFGAAASTCRTRPASPLPQHW